MMFLRAKCLSLWNRLFFLIVLHAVLGLSIFAAPRVSPAATDGFRPVESPFRTAPSLKSRKLGAALRATTTTTDAGPQSGLPFPNDGNVPQDVAAGDWNRDGNPDLAIAYGYDDAVRWFYGMGGGRFSSGGSRPVGINPGTPDDFPRKLWPADLDGDGCLDLLVLCSGISTTNSGGLSPTSASLGILYGTPGGGFESFVPLALWPSTLAGAKPQFPTCLAAGVVDNAGGILVVVGFMDSRQLSVLYHRGGRAWAQPALLSVTTPGAGPADLALADLNFDGLADLVVLDRKDVQVWQGTGQGTFGQRTTLATGQSLTSLALADFDQDGAWDLATLDGGTAKLQIFLGLDSLGTARKTCSLTLPAGSGPCRLLRYDANRDGRDDLAVLYLLSGGGTVVMGQPSGSDPALSAAFSFATARQPCALAAADFNRDGWPDLAVVNQGDRADTANQDLSLVMGPAATTLGSPLVSRRDSSPGFSLASSLARPRGLAWDSANRQLWTVERNKSRLARITPNGLAQNALPLRDLYPVPPPGDPTDIALDASGDLWITDRLEARLLHLRPAGGGTVKPGFSTLPAGLLHPSGLAFDPARSRLLVSDEVLPSVVAFTSDGTPLKTYAVSGGRPLRDLAWDAVSGHLWAVPENEPDRLLELVLDDAKAQAAVNRTILLSSLAPLLAEQTIRALAIDPDRNVWLLTDAGALIQATTAPALTAIHDLSLLRRNLAATAEPEGTLLVADGGVLSTLFRLTVAPLTGTQPDTNPPVEIKESFALCVAQSSPLHICGLARASSRIYVLDGVRSKVFLYGLQGQTSGTLALTGLQGRRPQGIYVDPATQHLWIPAIGRLLEFDAKGQSVASYPIPTTMPPTSIVLGHKTGELAILSTEAGAIMVFPRAGGTQSINKFLFQATLRNNPFRAISALPLGLSSSGWRLVGSDANAVILTEQDAVSASSRPGWQRYE